MITNTRLIHFVLAGWLLFAAPLAFGKQYVGRFDVYGGFMYLESPYINLAERGFHLQAGVRAKPGTRSALITALIRVIPR
ncbi:MAG: hypothetical protein ACJ73N_05870 [Bryobacteraceae bacterium]